MTMEALGSQMQTRWGCSKRRKKWQPIQTTLSKSSIPGAKKIWKPSLITSICLSKALIILELIGLRDYKKWASKINHSNIIRKWCQTSWGENKLRWKQTIKLKPSTIKIRKTFQNGKTIVKTRSSWLQSLSACSKRKTKLAVGLSLKKLVKSTLNGGRTCTSAAHSTISYSLLTGLLWGSKTRTCSDTKGNMGSIWLREDEMSWEGL